ncbi:MAG: DoxX family protein [Candidatus Pacearchaeota archaeon]
MVHSKDLGLVILRVSLALVFLYFGFSQIYAPDKWTGFVPEFMVPQFMTPNNLVILNGLLELILGTFLIIGLYVRISSLILALHLFGITLSIGFTPLGVRDFGLAFATLALYFLGYDKYTLDQRYESIGST